MTPFGDFPDFDEKPSDRDLSDDDIRWLVLWVTQLAKRYMSKGDIPESVTRAVEGLHQAATKHWGKGKLASAGKDTAVTMEVVRRLILRNRVHPVLTEATDLESLLAKIGTLFSQADFAPPVDFDELLAAYFNARQRALTGATPAGEIAYELCEALGAGIETLRKAHTTLNKIFGIDYAKHQPEHLAVFLAEHDLRFESDWQIIEFFLHDIMQVRSLTHGPNSEDRAVHKLSFRDADAIDLSRGRLAVMRNMTKQQLSELRATDPDQFRALVGAALAQRFAASDRPTT
jgi:hypothetical protein